jgi:hypothetical protein
MGYYCGHDPPRPQLDFAMSEFYHGPGRIVKSGRCPSAKPDPCSPTTLAGCSQFAA